MNPLGFSLSFFFAAAILLGTRPQAILGMLAAVLYLPQQQAIDVLSFNVTGMRLMEVAVFARVVMRKELLAVTFNRLDASVFAAYGVTAMVYVARSATGQAEAIGGFLDATLCYFSFRALVVDDKDLQWVMAKLVFLLMPLVCLLAVEAYSGENPFAVLGTWHSWVELQDDRVRAMGPFRNPSLLGTFGASLLPLYVALWFKPGGHITAAAGFALGLAIVYLANSGGPYLAVLAGLGGWLCWPIRRHMYLLRRALILGFLFLSLAMEAPIWSLLERVSLLTGGSGWHRAHLLSAAAADFDRWWLVGMPLSQTKHWFPYILEVTGSADITNAFLDAGLKGGLLSILLFCLLYCVAYARIGSARMEAEQRGEEFEQRMLWGIGCVMTLHLVTWFSITYFDQMYAIWFLHLAAASSLTQTFRFDSPIGGHSESQESFAARRNSRIFSSD